MIIEYCDVYYWDSRMLFSYSVPIVGVPYSSTSCTYSDVSDTTNGKGSLGVSGLSASKSLYS